MNSIPLATLVSENVSSSTTASLQLSSRLNHSTAPTGVASEIALLASLAAVEAPEDKARKPLDLVIVLDRSGSMGDENKLELCKQTLHFLIDQALSEHDFLSLILFDTDVQTYFSGKMTRENKATLSQKVSKIRTGSSTNLSGGLFQGLEELKAQGTADVCAVCLLTDGMMNHGVTDRSQFLSLTQKSLDLFPSSRKPAIFTFGYGSDADSDLLSQIAQQSGGSFYAIRNVESVPLSFATCLGGLMAVAAQNVDMTCEVTGGGAEFACDPMTRFPFEKISSSVYRIKIKDLYCGERRDILFKIRVPAFDTEIPTEIKVSCKYMDILNEKPENVVTFSTITRAKGDKIPDGPGDVEVERQLLRVEAAQIMEETTKDGDAQLFGAGQVKVKSMMDKVKLKMKEYALDEDEDAMLGEVMEDLKEQERGLTDSFAFKQSKPQMQSKMQGQFLQRNAQVDRMMTEEGESKAAYVPTQTKKMIASAKATFGYSKPS